MYTIGITGYKQVRNDDTLVNVVVKDKKQVKLSEMIHHLHMGDNMNVVYDMIKYFEEQNPERDIYK